MPKCPECKNFFGGGRNAPRCSLFKNIKRDCEAFDERKWKELDEEREAEEGNIASPVGDDTGDNAPDVQEAAGE